MPPLTRRPPTQDGHVPVANHHREALRLNNVPAYLDTVLKMTLKDYIVYAHGVSLFYQKFMARAGGARPGAAG